MNIGRTVIPYLLNCVEGFLIYVTVFHMTRMKRPPLWKIIVFTALNAFQIYFFRTSIESHVLGSVVCITAYILLVMVFFGWKLTSLAATSVYTVIVFLSEGIVTLLVSLFYSNMRYMVYSESYISFICVILSRCIQCFLTYVFISKLKPKNGKSFVVIPRFILLGLIVVFLMVLSILTVYVWALSNEPIPDWSLIVYIMCTVSYIAATLIILRIAVQSVRELEERRLIDMQGALSLEVHRSLEQLKEYEHNYRKHLQTILCLTHNGLHADAEKYYRELVDELELAHMTIIGSMPALSAAIQRIKPMVEKNRINLELNLPQSIKSKASELHLCVILSNLLDNAVEACEKVAGERRISLKLANETGDVSGNDRLCICIENTFDIASGKPHFRRDLPLTTKEDRELHGYGLRSVKRIVEMYGGGLDISYTEEGLFKVGITL